MNKVAEINASEFESEVLKLEGVVLVDFYGSDCVICEAVAGWFDAMEGELSIPVRKIFLADPRSPLAQMYQLRGIPTLIRFENGVEKARMAGQFSLDSFRDFVLQV